ncbi:MAG: hypothetical protein QOF55_2138 [Thermoleophilaceae bacterium]|nr:hypothetical protein [Thermoleophilaceae bacterium]
MSRLVALLLAGALGLALGLAASGCGVGPGAAKSGAVELRVTRDFGSAGSFKDARRSSIRDSDTVMRFLEASHRVTTRFGGGFVQSIDGLAGSQAAERDWFYYVNGSEASVGAADFKLSPGDVVQWDHHDWRATQHVPAIVGAYPEPFLHGQDGKRLPLRVECEDDSSAACREVGDRLAAQGAQPTSSAIGAPAGEATLRVIVAKFKTAAQVRGAQALTLGPAASGVYARFDSAGTTLSLLDSAGHAIRTAPPGTGLVAATQQAAQPITWLVTGVDDAGVLRAAHALSPATLRDAFAVAVEPTGVVKLPVKG